MKNGPASAWYRLTRFWDALFLFSETPDAPGRGMRKSSRKPRPGRLAVERLEARELLTGTGWEEPLLEDPLLDGSASTSDSGSLTTESSSFSVSSTSTASLPFHDLFNRANSTSLGGSWVNRLGSFAVEGNRAVTKSTGFNVATLSGISAADVFVEADVDLSAITNGSGAVVARYAGSGDQNMYAALLVKNTDGTYTGQIWRNLSGSWLQLSVGGVGSVNTGARLRFEVVGTAQRLYVNGSLITSSVNDDIAGPGSVGIRGNVNVALDDFAADLIRATAGLPFSDTFERPADPLLGNEWADRLGDFVLQNPLGTDGKAAAAAAGFNVAVLNGAPAADVFLAAYVDLTGIPATSNGSGALVARYGGPADRDMYAGLFAKSVARDGNGNPLYDSGGNLIVSYSGQIWKNLDGTWTLLSQAPVYAAGAGIVNFQVFGTSLRLDIGGITITAEDSSITSPGLVGIRSNQSVTFNDFSAVPAYLLSYVPLPSSDDFQRANDPETGLGPDWTDRTGDLLVSSYQAKAATSGGINLTTLNSQPVADVGVRMDVNLSGVASGSGGAVARYAGPGDQNMYAGLLVKGGSAGPYTAQIWRNLNGVWTKLTEHAVASGTGQLRFEVVGTSLKLYFNGQPAGSTTDGSITAPGLVGFRGIQNALFDNFRAGNRAPVLAPVGSFTLDEGQTLAFTASATDPDASDTLTYSLASAPAGASINAQTGTFAWTPTEAQGPGTYTFTVKVTDDGPPNLSDEETVTVTVNEANQAPVVPPVANQEVREGQTLSFTVPASDPDSPANALTYSLVASPNGASPPAGASIGAQSGLFAWTPTAQQAGVTHTVTVRVTDNGSPSRFTDATFSVLVKRRPTLEPVGPQAAFENQTLSFTIRGNDPDAASGSPSTLQLTVADLPGATVTANNDNTWIVRWTPGAVAGTPYAPTFTVSDGQGGTSIPQTVSFSVHAPNEAPALAPIGPRTVSEGHNLSFRAWALDPDGPLGTRTFSLVDAPQGATIDPQTGEFEWLSTYIQWGQTYHFTVRVAEDRGLLGWYYAQEAITVTAGSTSGTNQAPVARGNYYRVRHGQAFTSSQSWPYPSVLSDDYDADGDELTIVSHTSPTEGSLVLNNDGTFTYTPDAGYVGYDKFTYTVSDGSLTTTATVNLDVWNFAPLVSDDLFQVSGGTTVLNVLANDRDLDGETLRISSATARYGSVTVSGGTTLSYTPPYPGAVDSIGYEVTDGFSTTHGAAWINETGGNTPPVLADVGSYTVREGQELQFGATVTDGGYPSGWIYFGLKAAPFLGLTGIAEGSLPWINTGTGVFTWKPAEGMAGVYTFAISVEEEGGMPSWLEDAKPVTITVLPANGAGNFVPPLAPNPGSGPLQDGAGSLPLNVCNTSEGPIRYADGVAQTRFVDLSSDAFGVPWGQVRSWTNGSAYDARGSNGSGMVDAQMPRLLRPYGSDDTVAVVLDGTSALYFDRLANGTYRARAYLHQLRHDAAAREFVLTDTAGNIWRFDDFSANLPAARLGQFKSQLGAGGVLAEVVTWAPDGRITELRRTGPAGTAGLVESWEYSYLPATDVNAGLLASVTLRQREGGAGAWEVLRKVEYAYCGEADAHGNRGDLRTATVKDRNGLTLDTRYYRYYKPGQSNGYARGLKYALEPASYARLVNDRGTNVHAVSDQDLAPYADLHFQYDSQRRVIKEVVQGNGCSVCAAGLGTYEFSYTTSSHPDGVNSWKYRTEEKLPDGNRHIVYSNAYAQVMLFVLQEGTAGPQWRNFYRYDQAGRAVLHAGPSAVTGHNDAYPDLLDFQGGRAADLHDSEGLSLVIGYGDATTATATKAGSVAGYVSSLALRRGEDGTPVPQSDQLYYVRTSGQQTIYPLASSTVYAGEPLTTTYNYGWRSAGVVPERLTVTYPTVWVSQNGPGTPDQETVYFDVMGRPTWTKDAAGYVHYAAYDAGGSLVKAITDVKIDANGPTAADYADVPQGWATPAGGGLHLKTTFDVDAFGRTTRATGPDLRTTYTVYNDHNREVRVYSAWDAAANSPTGPTWVYREDRGRGYVEGLTMAVAPSLNPLNGLPNGGEAIGNLQTLARRYSNKAGQVTHEDAYFNLADLTYGPQADLGKPLSGFPNNRYYQTQYVYDQRGRLNQVTMPTGTIYRTVYDTLGRPGSDWVGISSASLTQVRAYEYDQGGVGDGNLTRLTEFPGGGAADRRTDYFYDWRNRPVAAKAGVEATEDQAVNRPISYLTYDNLGRVTAAERYDGDGVSVVDADGDGVPDRPAAGLLRAQSTAAYDARGRLYSTHTYRIDPVTGTSSGALATNNWYDRRGLLVKTEAPGGLVSKNQYDGAARLTVSSLTDGGGDTTWDHAVDRFNTTDVVLEQTETSYDAAGRPTQVTTRQRFHDASGTGPLGTPTSGVPARVSYAGLYYDAAGRLTESVDVGTNGAAAWTRPAQVPARSDTALVTSYAYHTASGRLESVTDPRGVTGKTFHDALGRTTKTVAAYTDGVPTAGTNKTTEFGYDGAGNLRTLKVVLPNNGQQTTEYVYQARTSGGSGLDSNELLSAVRHPDPSTGAASATEQETFTVNALGQPRTAADRKGSVHTYGYDALGRLVSDAVTTLGAGADGQVRRLETAYDGAGRPSLVTSYAAASGGAVVNQVRRDYNGLGQLTAEYQAHAGAVDPAATPKVQYAYLAGGTGPQGLLSVTYPNGRVLYYDYATATDYAISRVSSLSDASGTLESYAYLGLGTVVRRAQPQPGTELTYVKQGTEANGDAGDKYTGLDRFGRVVDQRWLKGGAATDRSQYGYDRGGNRTFKANVVGDAVSAAFSELYSYDDLGRLVSFDRGTLNAGRDGLAGAASRSQDWSLDAQGNWAGVTTDGATEGRTHNAQNEIGTAGGATLTYDRNGNLTTDEQGRQLVYDAWNRVVEIKDAAGATLAKYRYDALGRRTVEIHGTEERHLYYSASWQVLEERVGGKAEVQYVWSPVYVDALVLRDRDLNGDGDTNDADGAVPGDERMYVQQDANFNVTALVDKTGAVVERYAYDPYGLATALTPSWTVRAASGYDWKYLHQGGRYDVAAGLYSFRHRDYSPTLGRWTTTDPIGFAGGDTNLYLFVGNRPVNLTDPSGLSWVWPWQSGWEWEDQPLYQLGVGLDGVTGGPQSRALLNRYQTWTQGNREALPNWAQGVLHVTEMTEGIGLGVPIGTVRIIPGGGGNPGRHGGNARHVGQGVEIPRGAHPHHGAAPNCPVGPPAPINNPAHSAANAAQLREQVARQEFASQAGWRTSATHGNELVHHAYNRHPSLATNSNGLISPQLYHQRAIGNTTNPASEIHRLGGTRYAAFNPRTGEFTVFSWEGGGGLAAGSPTIHSYYIPLRNQMATGVPFQSQGIVNLADIRP